VSDLPSHAAAPRLALVLGYAGLLPQLAAVAVLLADDTGWRFAALALGYAYAALILSFLGGIWWGIAAQAHRPVPAWLWVAAVAPSLVALASAIPWAIGKPWPGPSLGWLGIALLLSLVVDYRLWATRLAPPWWLHLRLPLSLGLGLLTLVVSYLA
jgi:hypothetical protein